jgi:hypothetical protein
MLSPLCLVLLQLRPEMSPIWYYGVGASRGLVNWIAVALSALSDVMPPKWRAPSFGLLLAGFSLGFAMAPTLALFLGHFHVSVLSLVVLLLGFVVTVTFFPETLPPQSSLAARLSREAQVDGLSPREKLWWNIKRPLWELSILNRSRLFRLLSLLAFFSGVVSSGDQTLLIYYIEERIGFDDRDIAVLFFMMGILGIFVQAFVLKILNDAIGERLVITVCFILGSIHNVMYGLAKNKATIFLAVAVSSFVGMSFPTISAIKSNNVVSRQMSKVRSLVLFEASANDTRLFATERVRAGSNSRGALFPPGSRLWSRTYGYAIRLQLHERRCILGPGIHVCRCGGYHDDCGCLCVRAPQRPSQLQETGRSSSRGFIKTRRRAAFLKYTSAVNFSKALSTLLQGAIASNTRLGSALTPQAINIHTKRLKRVNRFSYMIIYFSNRDLPWHTPLIIPNSYMGLPHTLRRRSERGVACICLLPPSSKLCELPSMSKLDQQSNVLLVLGCKI